MNSKQKLSLLTFNSNNPIYDVNNTLSNNNMGQSNQSGFQLHSQSNNQSQNQHKHDAQIKKKKKHKKKKKNSTPLQNIQTLDDFVCKSELKTDTNTNLITAPKNQPTVVRHNIYQIKRNIFSQNTTNNPLKSLNSQQVQNLPTKKPILPDDQLDDKQKKAISSMFGQFFKPQNLKNYQKKIESIPDKKIQTQISQSQVEGRRIIKTVKPLISTIDTTKKQQNQQINNNNSNNHQQQQIRTLYPVQKSNLLKQQNYVQYNNIDQQKPISPQTFGDALNKIKLARPLIQSQSKGSFNISDDRNESKIKQEGSQKMDKNQVLYKKINHSKSSKKFIHFAQNAYSHQESSNSQMAQTPFFPKRQTDNNQTQQGLNQNKHKDFLYESISKSNIQNCYQKQHLTPQKTVQEQKLFQSYPNHALNSRQKQCDIRNIFQTAHIVYPKRSNKFMSIQEQMLHIQKLQKDVKNPINIDVFSCNAEEISNNFIDEMDKQLQNNYIKNLVQIYQKDWKHRLIQSKQKKQRQKVISPNKTIHPYINNLTYHINYPKPTQACSPSKQSTYIEYESTILNSNARNQDNEINEYNEKQQNKQLIIKNTLPLRLPTFAQSNYSNHCEIDYSINDELSSIQQESNIDSNYRDGTFVDNVESNINGLRQQINQYEQRYQNDSKQQLRQYYKYLEQKQSYYRPQNYEQSSQSTSKFNKQQHQHNKHNHTRNKSNLHNVHQIKQTSKPVIINKNITSLHHLNHDYNINKTFRAQNNNKDYQHKQVVGISKNLNLQALVMTFRRNNQQFDNFALKDQVFSMVGSNQHSIHQNQYQNLNIKEQSQFVKRQNQNKPVLQTNQINQSISNHQFKSFPTDFIQPIKITSKSKSKSKNKNNTIKVQKSNVKKINIVSSLKSQQLKPPQVNNQNNPTSSFNFLIKPSPVGSFMLNSAIKNYIVAHPNPKQHVQLANSISSVKLPVPEYCSEVKQDVNLQQSTKKKISIKKNPNSSNKKLSINQKNLSSLKKTILKKQQKIQNGQTSRVLFHKLNPQLQQTISRINIKPQIELHNMIKSRITQKSHSRYSSQGQSPVYNKLTQNSKQIQNSLVTNYQYESRQYDSRKINNKYSNSVSKQKQLKRSKNNSRSRSSRKSGIQLWNQGLSQFKQSRRQNGSKSPKIFIQKSSRQNEKIIGITKWNENLSKYKNSRSKSNQSKRSIGSDLKQNKSKALNKNYPTKQQNIPNINVQIKRHKYQVVNVQRRNL